LHIARNHIKTKATLTLSGCIDLNVHFNRENGFPSFSKDVAQY